MAKWEHWFWVTIFLLFESRCHGQVPQPYELLDTLTAPTLSPLSNGSKGPEAPRAFKIPKQPPRPRRFNQNRENEAISREKLTIITPSSVVVMSTARPRPVTETEIRNSNLEAHEKASTTSKPKD